ncbi:MAG: hypothetical protein ACREH8_01865 [Opitutaceae bacterium]
MKSRWDENELNTPEEMVVRTTFLVCVGGFTGGIILLLAGAAGHDVRLALVGGSLLVLGGIARGWLRRRGKFESADVAWNEVADAGPPADAARVAELVRLLRKWDELERKRGSSRFDPWALQAIRHDIRIMVETDPALEDLFHDSRRAA